MAKRGSWFIWFAWLPPAAAVAAAIVLVNWDDWTNEQSFYGVRPPHTIDDMDAHEGLMRKAYFVCLDNAAEDYCLERFGRLLWYPRDPAECEGIGARVNKVIALGGDPRWIDLFKNERCARLDMPYSDEAVNAGERAGSYGPHAACDQSFGDSEYCDEKLGNHLWFPPKGGKKRCRHAAQALGFEMKTFWGKPPPEQFTGPEWAKRQPPNWKWVFRNERCWRLGKYFHVPRLPR